nr:ribonuclease H-like domain-containing protein [Tanacetum cinerariifolium]
MEADDQAIQTFLMGLYEDIYDVVDSYETSQEIWLRVQQIMKGSDFGAQEKKAKLFNEWEMFTSTNGESIESYYPRIANQNGNDNVVAARAEGDVRPRRRDDAYLQTQLLIAQKEETGFQLQAEEFDLMAATCDIDEIKEISANCILMANLQQASSSGTKLTKLPSTIQMDQLRLVF